MAKAKAPKDGEPAKGNETETKPVVATVDVKDIEINGTVTVQDVSGKDTHKAWVNPANVTFNVKYPKEYKGPKHMPEGPVVVSKETAEHFVKLGIGNIEC